MLDNAKMNFALFSLNRIFATERLCFTIRNSRLTLIF